MDKKTLSAMKRVAKHKTNISVLNMVHKQGDKLTVTNLEIYMQVKYPEAERLTDGLYSIEDIELFNGRVSTQVTPEFTSFDDYPEIPSMNDTNQFTIDKEKLKRAFTCVSTDNMKYTLNGVLFEDTRIVAIDGRRMMLVDKAVEYNKGFEPTVKSTIVPAHMLKVLPAMGDKIAGSMSVDRIVMSSGDITISMHLLQGKFPNYKMFLPESLDHSFTLPMKETITMLKDSKPFLDKESNKIQLNIIEDRAYHTAGLESTKTFSTMSEGTFDKPIGLNHRLFAELIGLFKNDTNVIAISLNNPLSPLVITFNNEDYKTVLMPMKLDDPIEVDQDSAIHIGGSNKSSLTRIEAAIAAPVPDEIVKSLKVTDDETEIESVNITEPKDTTPEPAEPEPAEPDPMDKYKDVKNTRDIEESDDEVRNRQDEIDSGNNYAPMRTDEPSHCNSTELTDDERLDKCRAYFKAKEVVTDTNVNAKEREIDSLTNDLKWSVKIMRSLLSVAGKTDGAIIDRIVKIEERINI